MSTKKVTIHVYTDPGHGWARVKKALLEELGIAVKVTNYSYMNGQWAYLEEDVDADLLLKTLNEQGYDYKLVDHSTNSRSSIRNYPRYEY